MQPKNDNGGVRLAIENALQGRKLRATPQAINTLVCAVSSSSPELVGDSDSLLLGLLSSGSYTIDLLRDAGADIDNLTSGAVRTVQNYHTAVSNYELDEAATRRSRLAEPHDIFCTFISSPLREVILQYFVRINQHDERFGRA
ncbi:MAG: hypothetical protein U0938_12880, partial [Thiobacillus sp.]|nr:hypothetical protein [Thiobacillus sp.]